MEAINLSDRLSRYMDAGFPILYLNTFEEKLAVEQIQKAATTQKLDGNPRDYSERALSQNNKIFC